MRHKPFLNFFSTLGGVLNKSEKFSAKRPQQRPLSYVFMKLLRCSSMVLQLLAKPSVWFSASSINFISSGDKRPQAE